jgi:hypothetical protein
MGRPRFLPCARSTHDSQSRRGMKMIKAIGSRFCNRSFGVPCSAMAPACEIRLFQIWIQQTKYRGKKRKNYRHVNDYRFVRSSEMETYFASGDTRLYILHGFVGEVRRLRKVMAFKRSSGLQSSRPCVVDSSLFDCDGHNLHSVDHC